MEDSNLIIVKNTVNAILKQSKIMLFGSRAKGTNSKNSDYDILIICSQNLDVREKIKFNSLISKELARENINSDIIIQTFEEVEIKKNLYGNIVKNAMVEGFFI